MVLLRHTAEVPPHGRVGRVGIDLHLGQKPKLGGRYADDSLIYTSYFVGSLYIQVSLSFYLVASCFISAFQNTKRPKIFLLFLSIWFFSLLSLVCFTCYLKIQKYFALFAILSAFVSKIENPKNIYCSSSVL
jgi:4-amino-4-deoxy-L-arabinose transferase-like glycosyltransferase